MKIQFNINYNTVWGQRICVLGSLSELGNGEEDQAVSMNPTGDGNWNLTLEVTKGKHKSFEYQYVLVDDFGGVEKEWGNHRSLNFTPKVTEMVIHDTWRSKTDSNNSMLTDAFLKVLMRRASAKPKKLTLKAAKPIVHLEMTLPRIGQNQSLAILGDDPAIGAWDAKKALIMDDSNFPYWKATFELKGKQQLINYKYVVVDTETKEVVTLEEGANRSVYIDNTEAGVQTVKSEGGFIYPVGNWKAAGVAIPVFSLRSENSMGVGEFLDLKLVVDWSKKIGMKMIQVLPISDTASTGTWTDSYPYAAISVFALHPIYLNLQALGSLSSKVTEDIISKRKDTLNELDHVDYEQVMRVKWQFIHQIFKEQKKEFLASKEFKDFLEKNKDWLVSYAAFCYLRDLYGTPDFTKWGDYAEFSEEKIAALTDPSAAHFDDVAIHYYVQFHLDKQLSEAHEYAKENGVVLKGDIPIGIYRYSADAWVAPELYNMNGQAGAPPDDFAVAGQNWGFPTYNWEEMAKDNFLWWRRRLSKMACYFDAYRIDHILGFFRIWEVPGNQVEGLMGKFNPALPIHRDELASRGLWLDHDRFCKPYIRRYMLHEIFDDQAQYVMDTFLKEYAQDCFELKAEFDDQKKIEAYFAPAVDTPIAERLANEKLKTGLFQLVANVLLFQDEKEQDAYHPRIALHFTYSYRDLDGGAKQALDAIYIDYFYRRNEDFWAKQAMVKLPAITNATNMLVCGEDLGMVPDCVPWVMDQTNILSLGIQRMSGDGEFGHPGDAPYMSVVTPSCHDMSTIRGWWEEDPARSQRFYNQMLGHWGNSPFYCDTNIVKEIIVQHLYSPAMWAVFPIQDLLGMNAVLRREDAKAEQINVPANPKHYWKYRFHMNIEELLKEDKFNDEIKELVLQSGRLSDY